ncbi:MAG: hypothetical protein KDJ75_07795 [Alphaproteobacteria bacterium]|nr:hypothetical protein [Alphaproteobacteria bacterium]
MRRSFYLLIYILCLGAVGLICLGSAQPAFAQETPEAQKDRPLKDIPDVYIKEALAFHERCMQDTQKRMYFDCRCLAGQYLEKRMERGLDASPQSIALAVGPGCEDGTGAAGETYRQCVTNGAMIPPDMDLGKYCECFASTYGKLYEGYRPHMNSATFVRLQAQAKLTCTDPDMAKKYYPPVPKNR